jgi:hypothetical protein
MMKWREQLSSDCPKRYALQLHDRCDLICPIGRRCFDCEKIVLPLQRITAATGHYRVGLMPLRELPRGASGDRIFCDLFCRVHGLGVHSRPLNGISALTLQTGLL